MILAIKTKCFAAKRTDAAKKTAVVLQNLTMDPNDEAAGTDVSKVTVRTAQKALK
jgi:hypothetical protein